LKSRWRGRRAWLPPGWRGEAWARPRITLSAPRRTPP